MSIIPEASPDKSRSEDTSTDSLPSEIEIDGSIFRRAAPGGRHKIAYRNSDQKQISLLPNPEMFETLESRELQVDVWKHNGKRYKDAGLYTADQNFDENGNLIESGYTNGITEINGEEYPFLRCYFNPHLKSIDFLKSQYGLYEDKKGEIIDSVITLDRLKREGEIATAEDTVDWEEVASELEVVFEEDIPIGNGKVVTGGGVTNYGELSQESRSYLGEEFRRALFEDTSIQQNMEDNIYFEKRINPRKFVIEETGLPSSANGLVDALKYNDKTGNIVVSDLGECVDAIFNEENNLYEVHFNSVDEFTDYHGISSNISGKRAIGSD